MEEYSSTPLFTVGQEIGNFLLSCGILSKAWEESDLARNSESFSLTEHEGVAYVAFPSFNKIESFIVKLSEYGEGNIQSNNKVFSDCLRGNDDKPALVHQGALKLFLHIMEKTDFQAKLQIYTDSKQRKLKPITFVGHSLGGAVATLATLWVLEKRLRQSSPFCITFGCPLVGDERLVEAVGRENWGGNFLHVISQHDIVPRMLLAPLGSIAEPLTAILPYWQGKVVDSSIQDACRTLLKNVLEYTYTVAHYGVESRGSEGVIKRSPYKPFGTYMFCSNHGAACIDNSETILMMLHLTIQSQELLSDNIVKDWFSEHIGYGSVLKPVIENSISGKRFAIPDSESSYEMGISLQLEAIGVGAQDDQTRIFFLPIAGDIENHLNKNVTKLTIELSFKKCHMAELEWYKERCEKEYGITYYDSFKSQDMKDIVAGDRRVKLGDFWDEIIEMWESDELPSDFESQNKWINAGNTYRRLVEPLDIAHYYLTNGNYNYLSYGRPNRHKVLQRWMEAKEKTRSSCGQRPRTKRASLTQDSCFWAHVEEAWKDLENLKQGEHESLEKLEKFEEYVTTMENALNISSDVFLKGSSFMRWWEEWKEFKKKQSPGWSSPLYNIMESESRFSSTVVVQPKIPSTLEIDCAQLRKRETELIRVQGGMFELEWYKMICDEKGDGYYDTFKNRNDESDISSSNAILRRAELNQFWDEIIGMCESRELPRDFQSRNKWINAGTVYRELAEPLDIAHYYRTCRGSGNYISDGRQKRHEVLEKWLEGRKSNRSSRDQKARTELPFLTRDSCFWAHVEEALKDLKKGARDQKKDSLEKFEGYVTQMINDNKISLDVFMERSSFMKWWQAYKQIQSPEWKLNSPLYKLMESEFWKRSKPFLLLSGRRTSFNFTVEHEKISTTGVVKKKIPPTKKKTPSTALVKEKIPVTNEESPSTDMVKEEIPPSSTAVVKEKIPVTKEESPSIYVVKEEIPSTKEENLSSVVKEKILVTKEESPSTGVVKEEIPVTKEESPSTDVVKEESPSTCVVKEEIPSSKEESPSTGGVIKNIPSTKENSPSTQNDVPAEGGASASSTSSASVKLSALTKAACEDARNVNLDDLINHISELLEKKDLNKKGKKKWEENKTQTPNPLPTTSAGFSKRREFLSKQMDCISALEKKRWEENKTQTPNPLPTTSAGFSKLREFLSKEIDCISPLKHKFPSEEAKKVAQHVINGIGQVHFAVAGLLLISNILERMESLSENEAWRLILLDEMFELAKHIKELNARPQLRKAMEEINKKGTELIMEAYLMCCYQINRSKIHKFSSTSVDKSELVEFEGKLQRISEKIHSKINLCNVDNTLNIIDIMSEGRKGHSRKQRVRRLPPENAENAGGN